MVAAARLCAGNGVQMRGRLPASSEPHRETLTVPEDVAGDGRGRLTERFLDVGPMATAFAPRERGDGLGGSRDVLEKVCWIQAGIGIDVIMEYLGTSSTAQGGAGSFKNWTPIGEVGWCDHGWQSESMDGSKGGWSVGLSIYPSVCLSVYLSIDLSI